MTKLTQPWRLRRSFGSQLVGGCVGSRCPEAGLEARVVLANRRVRLFTKDNGRRADVPTCRRADVPTCRRADVPTWMTVGIPVRSLSSSLSPGISSAFKTSFEGLPKAVPPKHDGPSKNMPTLQEPPSVAFINVIFHLLNILSSCTSYLYSSGLLD
jgi:hypothetical protein